MNSGKDARRFIFGLLLFGVLCQAVVGGVAHLAVLRARFAYENLFPGLDLPRLTYAASEFYWLFFVGALAVFVACGASRHLRPYAMYGLLVLDILILLFLLWGLPLPFTMVHTRLGP